jgi:hypothetical protein
VKVVARPQLLAFNQASISLAALFSATPCLSRLPAFR